MSNKIKARTLLRAQINSPLLYRIFNIFFAVIIITALVAGAFNGANKAGHLGWQWMLGFAAVGALVFWLLMVLFSRIQEMPKKIELILVPSLFLVFFGLQIYFGMALHSGTDASIGLGATYVQAREYILNGILPNISILPYQEESGVYLLWCGFFYLLKLFGITNFITPAIVLNALAMNASILGLYFCARRLFGSGRALFVLLMSFLSFPLLFYVGAPISETLVMPFVVFSIFMWFKIRAKWRKGNMKKALISFVLFSAFLAVGAFLNKIVLVVLIAALIDLLFLLCGKGRFVMALAGVATSAALMFGIYFGASYLPPMPSRNTTLEYPLSAKIMMGLKDEGVVNEDDFVELQKLQGRSARDDYAKKEIQKRLSEKGILGVVTHMGTKLGIAFGDGTFGVAEKLGENTFDDSVFGEYIGPNSKGYDYLDVVAFAILGSSLIWCVIAAVFTSVRQNFALTFVRTSLFGVVLAMVVFLPQPHTLVTFVPIFWLCSAEICLAKKTVSKHKKAKVLAEDEKKQLEEQELLSTTEVSTATIEMPNLETVRQVVKESTLSFQPVKENMLENNLFQEKEFDAQNLDKIEFIETHENVGVAKQQKAEQNSLGNIFSDEFNDDASNEKKLLDYPSEWT